MQQFAIKISITLIVFIAIIVASFTTSTSSTVIVEKIDPSNRIISVTKARHVKSIDITIPEEVSKRISENKTYKINYEKKLWHKYPKLTKIEPVM